MRVSGAIIAWLYLDLRFRFDAEQLEAFLEVLESVVLAMMSVRLVDDIARVNESEIWPYDRIEEMLPD